MVEQRSEKCIARKMINGSQKNSEDALVEFLQQTWPFLDSFDKLIDGRDAFYGSG